MSSTASAHSDSRSGGGAAPEAAGNPAAASANGAAADPSGRPAARATERTEAAPAASLAAELPDDVLLGWLRDMLLIREFEVRTMQAYQEKKIGGFCHVYIGQEAVAVGCTAAIERRDPMVTAYRDHGHALARGMDPRHCMAEMFGRIGGCAKGKGGSMHMFDKANNLFGGHGIVGAQTPLGAGLAFATKYEDEVIEGRRSDRVTLCFLGDGALNQGAFHEAKNLAGLLDLPVIFVVENNGYSMGTSISRGTTMGHDISVKAAGYGIEAAVIDGMDVMTVYDAMKPLVDRCRATSRPAFVDMRTYRYKGHSMSDPRKYRTRAEEEQYEASDPIGRLAAWLESSRGFSKQRYDELAREVRQQVRDCVKWAEASPEPPIEELYTDVYVERFGPYLGTSPPQMLRDGADEA
ncbi:MAG TPA: pyruvate dehydrogenase (acetyl-transferring) E1 component subunit alpha [Phycisphaerales bacterium]|nr:pyruvate dehydrogenase (acetyl-transferring) E1 component subunit alpha [Phycisphaerales bacterium]HMP37157.1 pyruvate dehydrogenase (acetyl-transferring) E1 component subunit alpha [Phycisphaerales bacterium]